MTQACRLDQFLERFPLRETMPSLLAGEPGPAEAIQWIETADRPGAVKAALFLCFDDLEKSHAIVQDLDTPVGSYLHAIIHRREGDFSNSKYWLRRAGPISLVENNPGYDPYDLVDRVQTAGISNPAELVGVQRIEWSRVFALAWGEAE